MDEQYLRLGLWNITGSLYKYLIANIEAENLDSQINSYFWQVAVDPKRNCFASSVVVSPWHQSWVAASLFDIHNGELTLPVAPKEVTSLRKETEFHYVLNMLSPPPIILKELSHLFSQTEFADKIYSPVQCISIHASKFMSSCLLRLPIFTDFVIQNLLCIWSPYFSESDNVLLDIYRESIKLCIDNLQQQSPNTSNNCGKMALSSHVMRSKATEVVATLSMQTSVLFALSALWKFGETTEDLIVQTISECVPCLCERKILDEKELYLSLISRNNADLLKTIIVAVDARSRGGKKIPASSAEIFVHMLDTGRHWIENILDILCDLATTKDGELSHTGLIMLKHYLNLLLILKMWDTYSDNVTVFDTIGIITAEMQVETGSISAQMVMALQHQRTILEWCQPQWRGNVINNSRLLSLAKNHSTLHILHCVTNLADAEWEKIKDMLCNLSNTKDQKEIISKACNWNWEIVTFAAFCVLVTSFRLIYTSAEILKRMTMRQFSLSENDVDSYNMRLQNYYTEEITNRICFIKQNVSCLCPLIYRIEILENLFSLLFLSYEDMKHETISSSGTEENTSLVKTDSSQHMEHCVGSENSKSKCTNQVKEHRKSADVPLLHTEGYLHTDTLQSPKTAESSERETLTRARRQGCRVSLSQSTTVASVGFVANRCVVRDLLSCLKECVDEASTYRHTSSVAQLGGSEASASGSDKDLPNRLHRLSKYISEATWRLQVLTNDKFMRDVGKSPDTTTLCADDSQIDWMYPHDDSMSESDSEADEACDNKARYKRFRRKAKSSTEMSSESGSQSALSGDRSPSCSATRLLSRNRKRENAYPLLPSSCLINTMLSSHSSLAVQCLIRGDLQKAELVLKVNEGEDQSLTKEVRFAEAYSNLKQRLDAHSFNHLRTKLKLNVGTSVASHSVPQLPVLQSIKETADANIFTAAVTSEVEHFISLVTLPSIEDINRAAPAEVLQHADCETAVVTADMLLTLGTSQHHSVSLLAVIRQHCPEPVLSVSPPGFAHFTSGVGKALEFLTSVISEDTAYLLSPCVSNEVSLPFIVSQSSYPLTVKEAKDFVDLWCSVRNALKQFHRGRDSDHIKLSGSRKTQDVPGSEPKHLHNASSHIYFQKLKKICSKFRSETAIKHIDSDNTEYLQHLYSYVKLLTSLIVRKIHTNRDVLDFYCYFDVLKNSIENYFGQLIFEFNIPPMALEYEASLIKHSLVHTVIKYCCPCIGSGISGTSMQVPGHISWGVVCLNNEKSEVILDVENPEIIVRNLLSSLLKTLKEYMKENINYGLLTSHETSNILNDKIVNRILRDTSVLSHIDLGLLTSEDECLAFYLNVTNLMWLHALLILEAETYLTHQSSFMNLHSRAFGLCSGNTLERAVAMKTVCYRIGQLGYVSLYSLQRRLLGDAACYPHVQSLKHLLGQEDMTLLETYHVPCDERILFSLANAQKQTPKVQVFLPETVDSQLDLGVSEYLNFSVNCQPNDHLILPELLFVYLESTFLNQEPESNAAIPSFNCGAAANYFSEESIESGWNSTEKLLLLLEFLCETLTGDLQVKLKYVSERLTSKPTSFSADCVSCLPSNYTFAIRLNYCGSEDYNEISSISFGYEDCWKERNTTDTVIQFLESHCWLLAVIVNKLHKQQGRKLDDSREMPSQHSINSRTKCLENLFNCEWIDVLKPLFGESTFEAALTTVFESEVIWEYFYRMHRERNWRQCAIVLSCLPDSLTENNPKLQAFEDIILFELASKLSSIEPWLHAKCIKDISRIAHCVLKNLSQWPGKFCIEILKIVAEDSTGILPPQFKSHISNMLHEVDVHEKVLSCFQNGDIKTWHDVRSISETNPATVLNTLLETKEFQICRQWVEYHGIGIKMQHLVDFRFLLLYIYSEPSDFLQLYMLLQSLDTGRAVSACEDMLPHLKTVDSLKFVLEFLVECGLPQETECQHRLTLVGTEMLGALPHAERAALWDIVAHPHLIVEQLLMNTQLGSLDRAISAAKSRIQCLPPMSPSSEASIDILLRRYASKALDTRVSTAGKTPNLTGTVEEKLLVSLASVFSQSDEFILPDRVPKKSEWVPDDEVLQCTCCHSVTFSMFIRRHHCRRCGRVICATCSSKKMKVDGYGKVAVRICDDCFRRVPESLDRTKNGSSEDDTFNSSLRTGSGVDLSWKLSVEEDCNNTMREEFSYEHAPSVSLCLAILKIHSGQEAHTRFLLDSCERMLQVLQPLLPGMVNPEVDHTIIIRMVKSLAVAAKVTLAGRQSPELQARCDQVLSRVDLLGTLATAGHAGLPISSFWGCHKLRTLRDRLLADELWPLALEVSTKCGLDRAGVWATWGKACLRAGYWAEAREHFSHFLSAGSRPPWDPPLLTEIIAILEEASLAHSGLNTAANTSCVLNSLASVDGIASGRYPQAAVYSDASFISPKIQTQYFQECIYYLTQYGSHIGTISFYLRHNNEVAALQYILSQKIEPDVFLHAIYFPSLQNGTASSLHLKMEQIDKSLLQWKKYLCHVCHYLEKLGFLNVLYQLQLFMKDYVRAAMTCIRFHHFGARNYTDLSNNIHYLEQARKHLQNELYDLQNIQGGRFAKGSTSRRLSYSQTVGESLSLSLDPEELQRHIVTIDRQMEVTKFLHECESSGRPVQLVSSVCGSCTTPPLLFGSATERTQLAALLILAGSSASEGFSLAQRVISEYRLKPLSVYRIVCSKYIKESLISEVERLVSCIKSSYHPDKLVLCDEIILISVQKLVEKSCVSDAETLIKFITEPENKISAYILCHQLKSAYLVAVKYDRASDVHRILKEAMKLENAAVQKICLKWLEQHGKAPLGDL